MTVDELMAAWDEIDQKLEALNLFADDNARLNIGSGKAATYATQDAMRYKQSGEALGQR